MSKHLPSWLRWLAPDAHFFTTDYRARRNHGTGKGGPNIGFFAMRLPRPLLWCRIFDHRPVVDGHGPVGGQRGLKAARWVVCRSCFIRPDGQGNLDPARWNVGDRYTGPFSDRRPDGRDATTPFWSPGPWPRRDHGAVGGQLSLWRPGYGVGFSVKVGSRHSEHTLAASVSAGRFGSLYLHTERYGAPLIALLNGCGDSSREVEVRVSDGRLWWKLWAPRDGWPGPTKDLAWHQRARTGSVRVDLVAAVLGPKRYSYEDVARPVPVVLLLPDAGYPVLLKLQRETYGRKRRPGRPGRWMVDLSVPDGGVAIPTEATGRGRIFRVAEPVSAETVHAGLWVDEALGCFAARFARMRAGNGWTATRAEPVPELSR